MINIDNYRDKAADIEIIECDEKLLEIPLEIPRFSPHPYASVGAPYNNYSPFFFRETGIKKLLQVQEKLQSIKPGFSLKIFDAYRPLKVQIFMIEYDKNKEAFKKYAVEFKFLTKTEKDDITNLVLTYWSPVRENYIQRPTPHSTGGAIDLTIVDGDGIEIDMGTKIDHLGVESNRYYFDEKEDSQSKVYALNRKLLEDVMTSVGFTQLPTEWWHYSFGDQIDAAAKSSDDNIKAAIYGIYETL